MPTFMDSLAANPTGSSGIYGQPKQDDVMSLVNQLKDRDMMDYKNKADFNADLQLRTEARLRNLYDPSKANATLDSLKPTVMGPDIPSPFPIQSPIERLAPKDQLDYGLKEQDLAQKGKFGQEALDIKSQQEELNKTKSEQINATKMADMQRKTDEANQRLALAQQTLNDRTKTSEEHMAALKEYQSAVEQRHQIEMDMKQQEIDNKEKDFKTTNDRLTQALKDAQNKTTTTSVNPDGTTKTVTTKTGAPSKYAPQQNSDGTYMVFYPDGSQHKIPGDKIDDWNQNHQPAVNAALGGGGDENQ